MIEADGVGVRQRLFEDAPLLVEGVGAPEPSGVAGHRIFEKPLIGLLSSTEHGVKAHLEIHGSARQLIAWSLGLEVEHDAVVLAEAEAQVVGMGSLRACGGEEKPRRRLQSPNPPG